MRTNRVFVPFSLQISPVSGEEGSRINIWSSLFTDAVRKPDVPHLKKKSSFGNCTNVFSDHQAH